MATVSYDPSRDRQKLDRLQAEFSKILHAFSAHQPLVRGSLQRLRRRCGKPGCRCQRGKLHESLVFIDRSRRQRRIRKVIVKQYLKLKKPTGRYQSLRKLRARLGKLQREVLECCDRLCHHRLRQGKREIC